MKFIKNNLFRLMLTFTTTSTTTCSPRIWAANGDYTDRSEEGLSRGRNVNINL